MSALTALGLRRSRITVLVMMLVLAVGALSYGGLPKREDPAITVRTAIVVAANPGLELEQLEELVALPLEEAARAIPGVDEVRTQLTRGAAILQVDVADAVPEAELKRVFDEIRDDMATLPMPEGTRGPVVNSDFGDVAAATVAVTGAGFALPEVEDVALALRDRLYALDAVAAVTLHGLQGEVITLELDRARLAAVGATLDPILAALRGQNVRLPSGSVAVGDARVPLETTGDLTDVDAIEDVLIEVPDLGLLRVGDVVTVRRGLAEPATSAAFQDGAPAIVLAVEMAEGEDITALGPVLRETVEAFAASQPIGIEASFSTFQPDVVEASVSGALVNMAQTFAVVLAVMLLFLGWREALVVAAIVPFAVSFAFALMGPFGVEIQQVSIAAIIISLGLLVDNGVVVVEDMQRRVREGAAKDEAALAAGRQYAGTTADRVRHHGRRLPAAVPARRHRGAVRLLARRRRDADADGQLPVGALPAAPPRRLGHPRLRPGLGPGVRPRTAGAAPAHADGPCGRRLRPGRALDRPRAPDRGAGGRGRDRRGAEPDAAAWSSSSSRCSERGADPWLPRHAARHRHRRDEGGGAAALGLAARPARDRGHHHLCRHRGAALRPLARPGRRRSGLGLPGRQRARLRGLHGAAHPRPRPRRRGLPRGIHPPQAPGHGRARARRGHRDRGAPTPTC